MPWVQDDAVVLRLQPSRWLDNDASAARYCANCVACTAVGCKLLDLRSLRASAANRQVPTFHPSWSSASTKASKPSTKASLQKSVALSIDPIDAAKLKCRTTAPSKPRPPKPSSLIWR